MKPFNPSRVILVQPPIEDFYLTKKRTIPYGLASIAASIQKQDSVLKSLMPLPQTNQRQLPIPKSFPILKNFMAKKI